VISGLIEAASAQRSAYRYSDDHQIIAVLPDWLHAQLSQADRDRLLAERHIIVRSRTEEYGPQGSQDGDTQ
jgi:hypothetical protein